MGKQRRLVGQQFIEAAIQRILGDQPIILAQQIRHRTTLGHFGDRLLHFYADRFALRKLPIELPIQPFAVAIVALKNRTISPVAQLFIDCAREVARPLVKRHSAGGWTGRNEKASGGERA